MHWKRWNKGKDPSVKTSKEMTLAELFWSNVDKRGPDECWPWLGATRGNGPLQYGKIDKDRKVTSAHHVAFELQNGPLPDLSDTDYRGTCVRHTCDFSLCMNGRHLIPGTHLQNMRDKAERNRDTSKNKTHCKHGHERNEENTWTDHKRGIKHCRVCNKLKERIRKANLKEKEHFNTFA